MTDEPGSYVMDSTTCEVWGCPAPATHRVGNQRGESIKVCYSHMTRLRSELVRPVVTLLAAKVEQT